VRRVLIVNPAASGVSPSRIAAVVAELAVAGPVEQLVTERPGHATELARSVSGDCEAIYVFAGDGGFNEVVNGITGRVAVGFIPGGASNILPRALGLPNDPVACARRLARSGSTRTITLGRADGRRFTFSAGVGLDAELVRAVDRRGRASGKRPGDLVFVQELWRILAQRRFRLEPALLVEGHGRCAFAIVANCDPYTYAGPLPVHAAPQARFELGLDLVAPVALHPADFSRLALSVLARPTHAGAPGFLYVHDADRFVLRCDVPLPMHVDGEDLGDVTEVILEAEREALTVLV
jgi:diacylglycerol kinase family enzyme